VSRGTWHFFYGSGVYQPQPQKKVESRSFAPPLVFYRVFFAFRNKGSSKTRNELFWAHHPKKSIWAHHNKCGFFSPFFFSPSVVLLDLFGRFWACRNKGTSKTRLKKSQIFLVATKKSSYLLTSLFFYPTAPLGQLASAVPRTKAIGRSRPRPALIFFVAPISDI
jgi:hypothetical protein